MSSTTNNGAATASAKPGLLLGFDYGTRRIGLAIGDQFTGNARPLPSVANHREPDWHALNRAIQDWQPIAFVVGLPLDLDGRDQSMTAAARTFAGQLRQRYQVPVHLCDERLSSRSALDELRNARADGRLARRVKPGDRDGVAARLILEQWMSAPESDSPASAEA